MNVGEQLALHAQPRGNVLWKPIDPSLPLGVPDQMINGGIQNVKRSVQAGQHPLEYSEKHFHERAEMNDFVVLAKAHGLHAPLRLKMERDVASRVQRLPGLPSSHLMSDILTGRLDDIEFEDFLNDPMNAEVAGQPHALMERRSNI